MSEISGLRLIPFRQHNGAETVHSPVAGSYGLILYQELFMSFQTNINTNLPIQNNKKAF